MLEHCFQIIFIEYCIWTYIVKLSDEFTDDDKLFILNLHYEKKIKIMMDMEMLFIIRKIKSIALLWTIKNFFNMYQNYKFDAGVITQQWDDSFKLELKGNLILCKI